MNPFLLAPNQPLARPYRGGEGIRTLRRGAGSTDPFTPEDFVGSTTCVFGSDVVGLSSLPDGTVLRDAIAADPEGWLGSAHVARYGSDTALLVKLLHTGERLFNHVHPDAGFAAKHLGAPRGKTECWIIVETPEGGGDVWLGFREGVVPDELSSWFDAQDADAMLGALNHLTVQAGDYVHVPAGTPHSIGPGITLVELQEPIDLSIILEYAGFPALDRESALLGMDRDTALAAAGTAEGIVGRVADGSFLPAAADPYNRAERVRGGETLEAGFGVLVVLSGQGSLGGAPTAAGDTWVIPFGAGELPLEGELVAIRCRPPRP